MKRALSNFMYCITEDTIIIIIISSSSSSTLQQNAVKTYRGYFNHSRALNLVTAFRSSFLCVGLLLVKPLAMHAQDGSPCWP